jgi:hypothetical protein
VLDDEFGGFGLSSAAFAANDDGLITRTIITGICFIYIGPKGDGVRVRWLVEVILQVQCVLMIEAMRTCCQVRMYIGFIL